MLSVLCDQILDVRVHKLYTVITFSKLVSSVQIKYGNLGQCKTRQLKGSNPDWHSAILPGGESSRSKYECVRTKVILDSRYIQLSVH